MPETKTLETTTKTINALISGITKRQEDFDYTMTELGELAKAGGYTVVADVRQKADFPTGATYFGSGKVEEIREAAELHDASVVIVNDELSPSQLRNLEKQIKRHVVDRTQLILDIFGTRARSKQAKMQVEIAQLRYALPRLRNQTAGFDQQGGGSTGGGGAALANRGSGETQLEMDKRVLTKRISHIKHALLDEEQNAATRSSQRTASDIPTVALVGYTNSGKSTTMNGLLNLYADRPTDKQVFEKDMLFATLDTSVRRIDLPGNRQFLLSDTVGFVGKLPTKLVDSFKATLAEAKNADLLIHVVDYADDHYPEMMKVTEKTLKDIGIDENVPVIEAFNKADLRADHAEFPEVNGNQLIYSARDDASLRKLADMIEARIFANQVTATYQIPFTDGAAVNYINSVAKIAKTDYNETGTLITATMSKAQAARVQKYALEAE
ncbi:GTPase HflX [Lacticaseibacillus hulanensis]|uniref:GTPase HflX n=1 Tax=Lacticaseibacillus hulanensis TaxID=2493111 RepID=UPI000FD9957E|nr:GTPase HflX [Lacticaseibacillus hulanensis]